MSNNNVIYTRDEAARIVEMFEDILVENGVSIPSPEDDDREPDDDLGLYGSVYSDLLDEVESMLIGLLARRDTGSHVISGEFSGKY